MLPWCKHKFYLTRWAEDMVRKSRTTPSPPPPLGFAQTLLRSWCSKTDFWALLQGVTYIVTISYSRRLHSYKNLRTILKWDSASKWNYRNYCKVLRLLNANISATSCVLCFMHWYSCKNSNQINFWRTSYELLQNERLQVFTDFEADLRHPHFPQVTQLFYQRAQDPVINPVLVVVESTTRIKRITSYNCRGVQNLKIRSAVVKRGTAKPVRALAIDSLMWLQRFHQ